MEHRGHTPPVAGQGGDGNTEPGFPEPGRHQEEALKQVLHEIAEDLMFDSIRVKCDCMKPKAKCECLVSIAGMVLIYEIEASLANHARFEAEYPVVEGQ